jgi:hypothetical protein
MSLLWQVGHLVAVILGLAYVISPKHAHQFGFEFLRQSSSDQSEASNTPVWLYRGLGTLLIFIGITGLL